LAEIPIIKQKLAAAEIQPSGWATMNARTTRGIDRVSTIPTPPV
jgi:hypothetical protein